ncbi:22524_t:CDS:2 [Cetraspora pellucida]|uniref:22524_t:CDS:1 n=1 Tax=Cetraspora pellucida TaxID=1433469 RepID=A0A9N9FS00_9GLOM|nr:22524_t:CDS:2 [Cetraspora pellucida]
MQKHTNNCLNASELAKTIKKPKLQDSNLIQQSTIVSYVNQIDHNKITNLDYKFTKAIYASDKLSIGLLENVYKDIKNNVKQKIDNIQNLTMVSDTCHTVEWITIQIITKIEEVEIHKFLSIITNIAANMKATWKIIKEKYSHIIFLDNIKTVVKYFKDYYISIAKLRHIQRKNYSKEIAFVFPVQLHLDEFWNNLKFIIKILKPIVAALKAFKTNNLTILSTYSCFNMILTKIQKISCSYLAEIQQKIQNHWNYIYHSIITIIFLLNPNYLEESKKNNHELDCLSIFANFISLKYPNEKASRIYANLLKFHNKQILYNNELIWNSAIYLNPLT